MHRGDLAAAQVLGLLRQDLAAGTAQRADYAARRAALAQPDAGIDRDATQAAAAVDELLRRIAAEAGIAHAALLGELRAQADRPA